LHACRSTLEDPDLQRLRRKFVTVNIVGQIARPNQGQFLKQTGADVIHPSVQPWASMLEPGFLDDGSLSEIPHLFNCVEFDESAEAGLRVGE
jgi:hypothetical protein